MLRRRENCPGCRKRIPEWFMFDNASGDSFGRVGREERACAVCFGLVKQYPRLWNVTVVRRKLDTALLAQNWSPISSEQQEALKVRQEEFEDMEAMIESCPVDPEDKEPRNEQ